MQRTERLEDKKKKHNVACEESDTRKNNVVGKKRNVVAHFATKGTGESTLGTTSGELANKVNAFVVPYGEFFIHFEKKDRGNMEDDKAEDESNDNFGDNEEEEEHEYEDDDLVKRYFNYLDDNDVFVSRSMHLDGSDMQDSTSIV